jgi:hypothetical protein
MASNNPHERAARAKKVLAMVQVLDDQMIRQKRNPHDQAGLVVLASLGWVEAVWLMIANKAGVNPPSDETKEGLRDVYRGRATAKLQRAS